MSGVNKAQADDIADFVTLVDTIRWPVADEVMWEEVLDHLKKVIVLNGETWHSSTRRPMTIMNGCGGQNKRAVFYFN